MSRVITFSRFFQKTHPKAGQPTWFVEGILNSLHPHWLQSDLPTEQTKAIVNDFFLLAGDHQKHHTIRAGSRWKPGDKFSPRVWGTDVNPKSGRSGPYQSKQITIAPDITIIKTWDFKYDKNGLYLINGSNEGFNMADVARNDGLSKEDFDAWFWFGGGNKKKAFTGQIICWGGVNY